MKAVKNKIEEDYNIIFEEVVTSQVVEVGNEVVSATAIRKFAYDENNLSKFVDKYKNLYGELTEKVFEQIWEGRINGENIADQIAANKQKKACNKTAKKPKVCKTPRTRRNITAKNNTSGGRNRKKKTKRKRKIKINKICEMKKRQTKKRQTKKK